MMFYLSNKVVREFDENLLDWCLGGPKANGWTREGKQIKKPNATLCSYSLKKIKVEEGLAKNKSETMKWHINFLNNKKDLYEIEYLQPRYDKNKSEKRMMSFIELFNNIKMNGLKKPIWVADISCLDLGFQYFRFNGCHRLCCFKVLGIDEIPAIVFKTKLSD